MRKPIEKLIAIIGALLVGFTVYTAPVPFGVVPCNIKPFSAKPTTILSTEKTADIITSAKSDAVLSNALNIAVAFIDTKQSAYKTTNGHYFKGNITHNTIPTIGSTALPENNVCGNKDGKTWADFGELTSALPFAVGVSPYTQGTNEGYTIEFFVQKGGRTFVKAVSRGFEATERSYDWRLQATAEGLAINKRSLVKDISKLKRLFKPYYALAVDVNSRSFVEANGDYAQANDSADLDLLSAFTFDFEMNPSSFASGGANRIIDRTRAAGGAATDDSYRLTLASSNSMSLVVINSVPTANSTTITFSTTFVAGTWYRITIQWDGSNVFGWVNCVKEFSGTNASADSQNTSSKLRIGAQGNASDAQTVEKFDGYLNNVAIYNNITDPTANNEADAINLGATGLMAYYDLENNGTDTSTADTAADNLTFTGTSNSATAAGALCGAGGGAADESIMWGDIF